MNPVNVAAQFEMTMKVRSSEDEGLIFYVYDGRPLQVGRLREA